MHPKCRALLLCSWAAASQTACQRVRENPSPVAVRVDAQAAGQDAAPVVDAAAPDATRRGFPPLSESGAIPLKVPGYRDAVVSVPRDATEPRPILVALHGNYDRPEWQCDVWRKITNARAFILCPRGVPRRGARASEDRWEYAGLAATKKELFAGLAALAERFAGHVDEEAPIFTGFSLGAILGRRILLEHPERFPVAVLVEGGHDGWSPELSRRYREGGGRRVLFACGQAPCRRAASDAVRALSRRGVDAGMADGKNAGHTYDGPVARAVTEEWTWLIGDDPRWLPPQ